MKKIEFSENYLAMTKLSFEDKDQAHRDV